VELWTRRISFAADTGALEVVDEAIGVLDRGEGRVAEIDSEDRREWSVHEWLRQAICLLIPPLGLQTVEYGIRVHRQAAV